MICNCRLIFRQPDSIAPKLNQQSYKSMEAPKIEPMQSLEIDEVKLPPATKLYRKIFKSYDKEKPADKPTGQSPPKTKKRGSIPKVPAQPRKISIEKSGNVSRQAQQKERDVNGSLPIIVVRDGEPKEALRTDKSNFTDAARTINNFQA